MTAPTGWAESRLSGVESSTAEPHNIEPPPGHKGQGEKLRDMPGEKPRAMPGLVAVLVVLVAASAAQEDVTDHILNSLSRAAAFLESEHENINLDGVVGYLIMQGE